MTTFDQFKVTPRDQQVLNLLAQGCSNKEIGDELNISLQTVKQHLRGSEKWHTHKQVSEQVGLQKIDDFATPPIDYGLHHEKTEALYLVQLNRRRQRQLLAVDHNFYEGRSWVA